MKKGTDKAADATKDAAKDMGEKVKNVGEKIKKQVRAAWILECSTH